MYAHNDHDLIIDVKSESRVKTEPKESCDSFESLFALSGTTPENQLSADQLKKRRRNERDRRRSVAKRETMEQMRKTVTALELQKQQLMQHIATDSPCSPAHECQTPLSWPNLVVSTSTPSTPLTRDDYVQLAAEIEEFRRQNAAMVQELARRDLFNNSLRYQLASFASQSRVEPSKLTHEEGVACVCRTLEQIQEARLLYASEERFHDRPTFLGWNQYIERQGESVVFSVKKTLRNVTPQELMNRSWQMQMDGDNLRRLGPSQLQVRIAVLQKITDDILIVDRRMEDQSRTNKSGGPLILRTMYVLFRVKDDDGSQTLGIRTLDIPVADRMLQADEVWWEIFYWIRVSPAELIEQDIATTTEFGGANSCHCENLAASRLKELLFLASRWETLVAAPSLLKQ